MKAPFGAGLVRKRNEPAGLGRKLRIGIVVPTAAL